MKLHLRKDKGAYCRREGGGNTKLIRDTKDAGKSG
jgi:hypothetical protein